MEYIDPVRVISNNSSGKMGVAVAEAALNAGAEVTLVAGKITVQPSSRIKVVDGETAEKCSELYTANLVRKNTTFCISSSCRRLAGSSPCN